MQSILGTAPNDDVFLASSCSIDGNRTCIGKCTLIIYTLDGIMKSFHLAFHVKLGVYIFLLVIFLSCFLSFPKFFCPSVFFLCFLCMISFVHAFCGGHTIRDVRGCYGMYAVIFQKAPHRPRNCHDIATSNSICRKYVCMALIRDSFTSRRDRCICNLKPRARFRHKNQQQVLLDLVTHVRKQVTRGPMVLSPFRGTR